MRTSIFQITYTTGAERRYVIIEADDPAQVSANLARTCGAGERIAAVAREVVLTADDAPTEVGSDRIADTTPAPPARKPRRSKATK